MKCLFIIPVFLTLFTNSTYAQKDTLKLYYDIGVSKLNTVSKQTIDSAIYFEILEPGKKLAIIGYADYLGSEKSNISLSENRAKIVQQYLMKMGIGKKDMQVVIGKGEITREVLNGTAGFVTDRRVDIIPGGIKEPPKKPAIIVATKPALPQLDISKIKQNTTITLENLYFEPGSHKVRDISLPVLEKLYNTMMGYPQLKIGIEGHICCLPKGNTDGYDYDSENFYLSLNRARAVYEYLLSKGISADRMSYNGFGISKPLFMPEKNEEQENKNRRVEIRVLSK